MATDYLSRRQNVVNAPLEELNAKLAALANTFGEAWLSTPGPNPLQSLWIRTDALATSELLNFGDAVERLRSESPGWLRGQIRLIKEGDVGQSAGAIFEILALDLFSRESCRVIPAPDSMPGFDGTLVVPDGGRVLLSIKNHGLSSREQEFLRKAAAFDDAFQAELRRNDLNGVEVNVLAAEHMDDTAFRSLTTDISTCLAELKAGRTGGELERPYEIFLKRMEPQYGQLSGAGLSSSCRIMSPMAANEQANFEEAIRKGCANLLRHTKTETDVCRMIILRLSNSASIERCLRWAEWYFGEFPHDPVDVVLLYQAGVTTNLATDTSNITHHIGTITGPRFQAWRVKGEGLARSLPSISVLVGTIAQQPPHLRLFSELGSVDLSNHYVYQRADAFRRLEIAEGATADLSTPAPGVMIHVVLERDGVPQKIISSLSDRGHVLALLP